ncbi:MAG: nucleoside hydrolase, partial [Deltaproteobacteria bacterium]|nr:nucleoside hydrolase [Deltaproteobacteria bacterium]
PRNAAAVAMAEALHEAPLSIVAIGPLTNVAALIQHFPDEATRIEQVVVVAGRSVGQIFELNGAKGVPDFNFECDPHAARVLLRADAPGRRHPRADRVAARPQPRGRRHRRRRSALAHLVAGSVSQRGGVPPLGLCCAGLPRPARAVRSRAARLADRSEPRGHALARARQRPARHPGDLLSRLCPRRSGGLRPRDARRRAVAPGSSRPVLDEAPGVFGNRPRRVRRPQQARAGYDDFQRGMTRSSRRGDLS